MRATGVGLLVAASLTTVAAPARADIESDILTCTGTVAPGTLHRASLTSTQNWVTCSTTSQAGPGVAPPVLWYDGPATSTVTNLPIATGVVYTSGTLRFTRDGTEWAISFYDHTVNNTMLFLNGSTSLDQVYTPAGADIPYHIQAGAIRDVARCLDEYVFPSVPDPECPSGPMQSFAFVAERVYDLPF